MLNYSAGLLRSVQKPIHYLGHEYNMVRKDPDEMTSLVALVFPDTYEIGMSHLGTRILYHLLNQQPFIAAERFFCPRPDMEAALRSHQEPLRSLENGLPLDRFHIIGFSLLYELSYTNILTVLDLGNLPFLSHQRLLTAPLVVGGGPVVSNPEPVADFFDLFVIGDGEETFPAVIRREAALRSRKAAARDRREYLAGFADIPGVYIPSLYSMNETGRFMHTVPASDIAPTPPDTVHRRWLADLDAYPLPEKNLVPLTSIVHDRLTTEISRGCMQGCRFCHAAVFYRPQRERSVSQIVDWISRNVQDTGWDEVSLASLSTGDFGGIEELAEVLMAQLASRQVSLSLPSLRVSELSSRLAEAVARIRKTGFTVAPEAGTQRLRDIISKGLTERDIIEGVLAAYRCGWDLVKLYFMIGLPFEEDTDVEGIARLVRNILAAVRAEERASGGRKKFQVNVSLSPFVPKPHTPFQWAALNSQSELRRKIGLIRAGLKGQPCKISWHDPEISRLECIFSRGDRRLAAFIVDAWHHGARLDGWSEYFQPSIWRASLARLAIAEQRYIEAIPLMETLPWSHLSMGVTTDYLRQEWLAAAAGEAQPSCGVTPVAAGTPPVLCHACGLRCSLAELAARRQHNLETLQELSRRAIFPSTVSMEREYVPVRFEYTKDGPATWLSHLDMIQCIQRIMFRADLPLKFTHGFHPRPALGFSPALGVGIASQGEYVDVWLQESLVHAADWLDRLNRVSVAGVRFLNMILLPVGAPSIEHWVTRARYRACLPLTAVRDYMTARDARSEDPVAWVAGRLDELLARKEIWSEKKRHGKRPRRKDVRPFLLDGRAYEGEQGVCLECVVSLGPTGSIRIDEFLELCLPGFGTEYRAARESLLGEPGIEEKY
ncbi:MAG: TIGR03960 family B12-binding radical SAM protein [Acidobacteria bacterium]|nr:TIGR03960 family B12-binding radical SAM protein [Acidobacteriota bacterium]